MTGDDNEISQPASTCRDMKRLSVTEHANYMPTVLRTCKILHAFGFTYSEVQQEVNFAISVIRTR